MMVTGDLFELAKEMEGHVDFTSSVIDRAQEAGHNQMSPHLLSCLQNLQESLPFVRVAALQLEEAYKTLTDEEFDNF